MAWLAIEDIFRVLWRKEPMPTRYFELVRRLQEGHAQIRKWQQSACCKGARHVWAAMQAHYPTLNLTPIAEKCPMNDSGKEVRPVSFFEQVMPAARISVKDCKLKAIIDNL